MSFTLSCFSSPHRCAEKKYPEDLPSISVILIYLNEALSVIKRAIRSIIDKTPARLLKEIILVDDHSSNGTSTCSDNTNTERLVDLLGDMSNFMFTLCRGFTGQTG